MLSEKIIRQVYAKNREKIVQYVRNSKIHGFFIVNFYKNGDVKIGIDNDDKAEFCFKIHNNELVVHRYVDTEFNRALVDYLPPSNI
jgi:hypothetical protein